MHCDKIKKKIYLFIKLFYLHICIIFYAVLKLLQKSRGKYWKNIVFLTMVTLHIGKTLEQMAYFSVSVFWWDALFVEQISSWLVYVFWPCLLCWILRTVLQVKTVLVFQIYEFKMDTTLIEYEPFINPERQKRIKYRHHHHRLILQAPELQSIDTICGSRRLAYTPSFTSKRWSLSSRCRYHEFDFGGRKILQCNFVISKCVFCCQNQPQN